ncbi:ArsR/SmtB family transcription factor [Streptomyces sp. 5K101]|uniref:ArsR/SmtB family transcription factor n=1 Tax=Streptomyces sp. 5K101 TaxID=3390037 RepID=UPI003975507B
MSDESAGPGRVPPRPPHPRPADGAAPDARSLRGLAHPLRFHLLGLLRTEGPATATRLARRTGVSWASAGYHVRRPAAYGFVEPDRHTGGGRERWWRAARQPPVEVIGTYGRERPGPEEPEPETVPVVLRLQAFPRPAALARPEPVPPCPPHPE